MYRNMLISVSCDCTTVKNVVTGNSSSKPDRTGRDGKFVKQSKMLNNSAYSRLGNSFCRIQSVYKFSNLIDCYFRYAKENVKWNFRAFQLSQIRCSSNNVIGIDVFTDRGKIII